MEEKRPKTRQEQQAEMIQKALENMSMEVKNIKIPATNILPAPNVIFLIGVVPEPPKTKSGIILPMTFKAGYKENDQKTFMRFFCVAAGDEVKKQTFGGEKIEPGDEVMYMDIPDSTRMEIPIVFDAEYFDRTGERMEYYVFDVMEIKGIVKRKKEEKKA